MPAPARPPQLRAATGMFMPPSIGLWAQIWQPLSTGRAVVSLRRIRHSLRSGHPFLVSLRARSVRSECPDGRQHWAFSSLHLLRFVKPVLNSKLSYPTAKICREAEEQCDFSGPPSPNFGSVSISPETTQGPQCSHGCAAPRY